MRCALVLLMGSSGCAPGLSASASRGELSSQRDAGQERLRLDYLFEVEREAGRPAHLVTRLCMSGELPKALIPGLPRAGRYLKSAVRTSDGVSLPLRASDGRVSLEGLSSGECLRLSLSLKELARQEARGALTLVSPGALTTSAGLWLWRPNFLPAGMEAKARFRLPEGVSLSAPWPRHREGGFVLSSDAFQLPSRVVLGEFTSLEVAGRSGCLFIHISEPTRL